MDISRMATDNINIVVLIVISRQHSSNSIATLHQIPISKIILLSYPKNALSDPDQYLFWTRSFYY